MKDKNKRMNKKIKKLSISIALAGIAITLGLCYFLIMGVPENSKDYSSLASTEAPKTVSTAAQNKDSSKSEADPMAMPLEDQLVRELKKYYGKTISRISTQASIYDIRNSIIGSHPEGKVFFDKLLKRAFPDLAAEISKTLTKLDSYNQWLAANEAKLSQMTKEQKIAALWEKRRELFGDAAEEIWSDEMLATETRKEKVQDALAFLNEDRDTSMEQKLTLYQNVLKETYQGSPEEYILTQKPILAKVFFSIDSVQDELKQMSPDQRQMTINKIRRDIGFSEQQVEDMEKRDTDRNQRWDVGLKYMEERKQVMAEFQGPEQEEKVKALREKYFKDEAQTIALEEKDNFFRFERQRFYGRN